jgi:hypothetical protein
MSAHRTIDMNGSEIFPREAGNPAMIVACMATREEAV